MNKYQKQVKKFCEERNWNQFHNPKDLLLGVVEEVGEFRNLIKWEQNPETIQKSLLKNKKRAKDTIGDMLWFLSILSNDLDIDMDEAIKKVIKDNKKRFPLYKTKNRHTNIHLGGHDGKYKKSKEKIK